MNLPRSSTTEAAEGVVLADLNRQLHGQALMRGDRLARSMVVLFVLLGCGLRIREYAFNRSLWLDESFIVHDLVTTSFRGLVKPLANSQAAPVGWVLLEKATIHVFGTSEPSFRLWPFLCSLATLAVFPVLARRVLSWRAAAVATLMIAVSPQLIYYSSEVKPYAGDCFSVLVIVTLVTWDMVWERASTAVAAGVGIGLLCWYSYPALFIAAVGMLLLLVVRRTNGQRTVPLVIAGAMVALADVAQYGVNLRAASRNSTLNSYWRLVGGFPPKHAGPFGLLDWAWHQPARVLAHPGSLNQPTLAFMLTIGGIIAIATYPARRHALIFLVAALLTGLFLGVLSLYPFAIRVALWAIPLALICLAAVMDVPMPPRRQWLSALLAVPVLLVSLSSIHRGLQAFPEPLQNNDARGSYAYVAKHWQPGDELLLERQAGPTYSYYGPRYRLQYNGTFALELHQQTCPMSKLRVVGRTGRIWLVFNEHAGIYPKNSNQLYAQYFSRFGTVTDRWNGYGDAAVYLLELPPQQPGAVLQVPAQTTGPCVRLFT